jgi:protein gp37
MTMQKNIDKGKYWDVGLGLVQGCNWVSPGCDNCWSAAQTHMRAHHPNPKIRARKEGLTTPNGKWNGRIRLMEDDLNIPLNRKIPTTYAIWNDLFHPEVPDRFIEKVFFTMTTLCRQHTFLILTKRIERILTTNPWFHLRQHPHIWIGVTVEHRRYLQRLDNLLAIPAAVRFVSLEPILDDIYNGLVLNRFPLGRYNCSNKFIMEKLTIEYLNWVIIGHESGPRRRPGNLGHIYDIVGQCKMHDIPVFVKQLEIDGRLTRNMDDFPEDLRLRQFPRLDGMGSSATHVLNE